MASITVSDLRPTGSDLFVDQENYLRELSDTELNLQGGMTPFLAGLGVGILISLAVK